MATHQITPERGGYQPAHSQLEKLEAMIAAAQSARHAAAHDMLFASRSGVALAEAIHDLIEVDGVFDLAGDIRREIGSNEEVEIPQLRPITLRPVRLNSQLWGGNHD
jgi:hypothetical protein